PPVRKIDNRHAYRSIEPIDHFANMRVEFLPRKIVGRDVSDVLLSECCTNQREYKRDYDGGTISGSSHYSPDATERVPPILELLLICGYPPEGFRHCSSKCAHKLPLPRRRDEQGCFGMQAWRRN